MHTYTYHAGLEINILKGLPTGLSGGKSYVLCVAEAKIVSQLGRFFL